MSNSQTAREIDWVSETRFGKWFQGSDIWNEYVLDGAISILRDLVGDRCPTRPRLLDVGCGQGLSFPLLEAAFQPNSIDAIDIDPELLPAAREYAKRCDCDIEIGPGTAKHLPFADDSFDLLFCHQLIHHVAFREQALAEMRRVLKPGGLLLVGESCLPFLEIYWVRWLFRHPVMEQKTAEGYVELVREAGFVFSDNDIRETTPWWARRDLGLFKKLGIQFWHSPTAEISIVASKPL